MTIMIRSVCLFLLICSCLLASAIDVDSLWVIWEDETMEDTVRLKAINDIANIGYMNDQPDSAFYCAQLQYDLAASTDNKRWMIKSLQLKGQSLWRRGDMHSAIDCFSKVLELEFTNDPVETARCFQDHLSQFSDKIELKAIYTETNGFDIGENIERQRS